MSLLDNIKSVAKYESKLLMRSWFYRVFLILAVLFVCIFNFAALISKDGGSWLMRALPSNIPYINLLILNTGQAVIAVFLSSEFLKTDKKLDTSEVFYVHPLSNAEYVIGKIWGNLDVFFRLNLLILGIVVIFNLASGIKLDWQAYITYFFLISIPTLIYIFGLSVALMLILKNQAITFVILLGYIGLTLFYIQAKFYYLFDYMVYNLPLVKSGIIGFSNWDTLINHRYIYFSLGLGFLCLSIFLFRRLPNTKYGAYRWLALSVCFIITGGVAGYNHVGSILKEAKMRALYTGINNKYVHSAKMVIDNYDISIDQHPLSISSEVIMKGVAQKNSSVFTFCLNPGLHVREIKESDKELSFKRESQIILVDFGREIAQGDSVSFVMKYDGRINEGFCYLDIPSEILQQEYAAESFKIDKKYSFQNKDYLLLTPETYWYPRPGTSYSSESPDWQQAYFSNFRLTVKTLNGLQALSQGTLKWPAVRSIIPGALPKKKQPKEKQNDDANKDSTDSIRGSGRNPERNPGGGQGGGQFRGQGVPGGGPGRNPVGGNPGRIIGGQGITGGGQGGQGGRNFGGGSGANQGQRRFQDRNTDQEQGQRRPQRDPQDSTFNQGQRRFQRDPQDSTFNQEQRRIRRSDRDDSTNQWSRRNREGIIQDSIIEKSTDENNAKTVILPKDSIFIFETDFPTPALTLIIGDYEQKSMDIDGTEFGVWHLRGNNYFYPVFESILDTIPSLIRERKRSVEFQYDLDYSYKRFSLVEVPVQFYSYVRTWTQAQEKMQPEMVLFPERGCLFNNANFEGRLNSEKSWAKRNGQDISDKEAAIRVLNGFMWTFQRTESDVNWSNDRGSVNVSVKSNPYLIFPQLYNFKYNVFSSEWTISNRLIEIYLQDRTDNDNWIRQMNGISNNEKANLLMEKHPFKELLSDTEQRDLLDNIIALKANNLFAPAERNTGYKEFRDSLRAVLQQNKFSNLRFENLLDTMGMISGEDLLTPLKAWNYPTSLPVYIVGAPEVTRITNRDMEVYVVKLQITNNSGVDGIINVQMSFGGGRGAIYDPREKRKVSLAAHETKLLVSVWEDAPRSIVVNTLVSANLPNIINLPLNNIARERNIPVDKENDYVIENVSYVRPGEVIVDNEDSNLFELSKPDIVGLLPKWLEDVGDNSFPYSGVSNWRPPLQWTLTTNDRYFGTHVRSAYVIKSGNGSQIASWKIPVPASGLYDLFYYVTKTDDSRRGRMDQNRGRGGNRAGSDAEYQFKVKYDDEEENAYISLRRADDGWNMLGTYFFSEDTVKVTLSNNCKLSMVVADAVKIVKR